jgi:hypothetical protein
MRQLLISSSIIFSLSFGLTSYALTNWDTELKNYASAANGNTKEFCKKSKSVRIREGKICNKSVGIAAYILTVCGGGPLDTNNVEEFTTILKKDGSLGSDCYQKAKPTASGKNVTPEKFEQSLKYYLATRIPRDKTVLCSLLPDKLKLCN